MAGMYGFGDAATQRFVVPGEEMTYTIYFENKADATAAAQEVRVTGQLSRWLDWSSFQLAEVGFRNQIDAGLSGKSDGISEVALEGTAWKVRTEVALNQKRGEYNCYLRIVDETTADGWPESPYDGFLPPNDDDHSGEGYIRYKVRVRDDAPMGARIDAEATIVFDYNDPITTAPAWFNWVGAQDIVAATGYMTWDETEGATYEVSIWTGEADPTGTEAQPVISSGTLTENRWRLPSTLQDGVTYFWRVTTTDAQGETTKGLIWSFDLNGRVSRKLTSGWNLVSLPFVPEAYSERVLLSRTLFAAEEEAFVRPLSLELGRAYWLWQGEGDEPFLDLFPTTETRGGEGLSLHGGWNMIGPTEEDTATGAQTWQYQPEGGRPAAPPPNSGEGYMIYLEE